MSTSRCVAPLRTPLNGFSWSGVRSVERDGHFTRLPLIGDYPDMRRQHMTGSRREDPVHPVILMNERHAGIVSVSCAAPALRMGTSPELWEPHAPSFPERDRLFGSQWHKVGTKLFLDEQLSNQAA